MKVGLIQPSSPFLLDSAVHGPLGLWYLGAALKEAGHEVVYCDRGLGDELPDADVWCLTGTTAQRGEMEMIVRDAPVPVIVGGPHASADPVGAAFDMPGAIIVVGEGERVLPKIVSDSLEARVFIKAPRITDLDALPFADRTEAHRYHYTVRDRDGNEHEAATAITSRGCPHRCAFCSHAVWGQRYTARSAADVVKEARWLRDRWGYRAIHFFDDSMGIDTKRLLDICAGLKKLGIVWRCFMRADQTRRGLLRVMAHSGCVEIGLGVESGSQKVLDAIHKGETVDQQIDAIQWAKDSGIRVKTFLIVGLPGDTWQTVDATAEFVEMWHPDDIDVSVLQVYPGSPIHADPAAFGIEMIEAAGWYKGRRGEYRAAHRTASMTADDLVLARDYLEARCKPRRAA